MWGLTHPTQVDKKEPDCRRFRVVLAYAGRGFVGWQQQHPPGGPPLRSVAGVVESAFREALHQRVRVHPAGRTDAGVSAVGQVAQFDAVPPAVSPGELAPLLNARLPPDCRVQARHALFLPRIAPHRPASLHPAPGCQKSDARAIPQLLSSRLRP